MGNFFSLDACSRPMWGAFTKLGTRGYGQHRMLQIGQQILGQIALGQDFS